MQTNNCHIYISGDYEVVTDDYNWALIEGFEILCYGAHETQEDISTMLIALSQDLDLASPWYENRRFH